MSSPDLGTRYSTGRHRREALGSTKQSRTVVSSQGLVDARIPRCPLRLDPGPFKSSGAVLRPKRLRRAQPPEIRKDLSLIHI
eukprot:15481387-Alexandrium_andersonii.AAC.1